MNDNDVARLIRAHVPEPDVELGLRTFRQRATRHSQRRTAARLAAAAIGVAGLIALAFVILRDGPPGVDRLETTATTGPTQTRSPESSISAKPASLSLALRELGLDETALPSAWLSTQFCGVDRGEKADAATRRCILDAHLARYPAIMLDTQNDKVTVLKTRVDGHIEWVATTKAAQSPRVWTSEVCERLSTKPTASPTDPTRWQRVNCDSTTPLETITRPAPPAWFLDRTEVPLCGIEVTVGQDRTESGRRCFGEAYDAGSSAEFAFSGSTQSSDVSYLSYWYRILAPNQIDVFARQESVSSPPVGGEPFHASWIRYRCTKLVFKDSLPQIGPPFDNCTVLDRDFS